MMIRSILSNLLSNPIHPKSLKFMANTSKDLITPNDQSNSENFETLSKESTESKKVETPHLKNQKSSQKSSWMKKLTLWSLGLGTVLSGIGVSRDLYQSRKANQTEPIQLSMTLNDKNLNQSEGHVYFEYKSENGRLFLYDVQYTANLQSIKFSLHELEKATHQIEKTYAPQEIVEMKKTNNYQKNILHTAIQQKLTEKLSPMIELSAKQVVSNQLNLSEGLLGEEHLQTIRQTFTKTDQETVRSLLYGEGPAELQEIQIKLLRLSKYFGNGSSGGLTLWDAKNFK
jgi:hypothetical protein